MSSSLLMHYETAVTLLYGASSGT